MIKFEFKDNEVKLNDQDSIDKMISKLPEDYKSKVSELIKLIGHPIDEEDINPEVGFVRCAEATSTGFGYIGSVGIMNIFKDDIELNIWRDMDLDYPVYYVKTLIIDTGQSVKISHLAEYWDEIDGFNIVSYSEFKTL